MGCLSLGTLLEEGMSLLTILCLLPPQFKLPKEYSWPEKKLKVSILPDMVFDSPLH